MALPKRETTVSPKVPIPKGYAFLPKGNQYKTLHCRRLTHEAKKTLYVVEDGKKVIGIRVPKNIFFRVQSLARETLSSRRAATETREGTLIRKAELEVDQLFPRIPKVERDAVLKRAFRKHSGRVGRSSQTPMPRKVRLAVIAHIRHKHTEYDVLLNKGVKREDARTAVSEKMLGILRQWGATEGTSKLFAEWKD
ncbi:hypothetical protein CC78DRAFT_550880 [Lojkania enalia]|uniref:DUF2293 domain-containing protein n=1 Tax=Lojkania enalia TaxID=147567 RepID=A0A9P4NAA4_9PLEO|nr:hypothetical protein CC78DRAFT_550880 [Didymosphaeria enalia]